MTNETTESKCRAFIARLKELRIQRGLSTYEVAEGRMTLLRMLYKTQEMETIKSILREAASKYLKDAESAQRDAAKDYVMNFAIAVGDKQLAEYDKVIEDALSKKLDNIRVEYKRAVLSGFLANMQQSCQ